MRNALHEHLPDDVLVRILDGAARPTEQDAAAGLAGCATCSARAELLRRRSARLTALLADADWPVPDAGPAMARASRALARRQARWRRARVAAAAVVLLLAVGVTVTPARAWVVRAAAELWSTLRGGTPAATPEPAPAASAEARRTVEFAPSPGELTVSFTAAGSGTVTLEADGGDNFIIEVAGAGAPDVLLLERTVRIDNRDAPDAAFRIRVPAQVARVRVQVGDGGATLHPRAELVTGGARSRPLR